MTFLQRVWEHKSIDLVFAEWKTAIELTFCQDHAT